MVPNPMSPQESRTPGHPQPGSGNPLSPRGALSNWMELRGKMCMVQPVSSDHLLVTLQNSFGTGGVEGQGTASSRSQQGQSGASSGTPRTSTSSQPKPSARSPLSPGKEVAPAQPQWPHNMAGAHPKPPPGGPKSNHRRVQYLYTPQPPQRPPAQLDASVTGSVSPFLSPDSPPQSSPPWREKSTQNRATESWHRATRLPKGAPSEGPPRASPGRARPKLISSLWWPKQQAESQVSPCPTSPLAGQQPNATKVVAKGTSGSGKDMAKPVLPHRASPTILHEAPTQSCSGDNGDKPLDTGFFAFLAEEEAPGTGSDLGTGSPGRLRSREMWQKIKRFLKEDSEEAELTQLLRDCPPTDSPRKVETPESRREPGHPLSEGHQDLLTLSALGFPAAHQSPWGQLDPYDSSEDDKEYVGFATLPNQVHRKSVKKGFDFTLMVAGESGLGKSTLVNSLFLTDMYRDRKLLNAEERITQTVEITKHVVDIEEKGVKLRLTIVDTPGFGDAVNNTECWKPVADYIDQQFEQYFRDESGLNRKNIQDNRVHCCIYFISPFGHGLRPLDVEFMRALHQRVNIVPVLAKADTLTPTEVERMKNKIREEIDQYGIRIYQFPECDSDEDEEFKLQDQALKESIPFAVIGSNTIVEAKGRRVRGRLYPWGIVEVENPSHCDFVKLRTMLVRTHMQDLKDVTRETHYENYRTQCIQSMTRMVVKERNRNKLTRESGTDFPIPVISPVPDAETEKLIREKDEELRRMQEMLQKIQKQMKDSH
nr:septin-4 [Columba livia]